jgi:hypothetical protein
MATVQTFTLTPNTPTPIVNGDGRRVWIQGGLIVIGGPDVNSDNGIFLSGGHEYEDFGNVALGETIYAFTTFNNITVTVFYYTTIF